MKQSLSRITQARHFNEIVTLYSTDHYVRDLLSCSINGLPITISRLVESTPPCVHTGWQYDLLEYINRKFNLQAAYPLTFQELYQAWYSSLNCLSLKQCLTQSSSNLGAWQEQYRVLGMNPPTPDFAGHLAIIAYNENNIPLGDEYYQQAQISEPLIEARYSAYVRYILRAYKMNSSQRIIQEYSTDLYSEQSDESKRRLWSQQYDLSEFPNVDSISQQMTSESQVIIWTCVLIKLGRVNDLRLLQSRGLLTSSAYINRCVFASANPKLLALFPGRSISPRSLAKKGYWDTLPAQPIADIFPNLVKFTLSELRIFLAGYQRRFGLTVNDDQLLELTAKYSACGLFLELYPLIPEPMIILTGLNESTNPSLVIADIILNDMTNVPMDISRIFSRLLVEIWSEYGKEYFEDALMYLQSLGIIVAVDELMNLAISIDLPGLVRYLLNPDSLIHTSYSIDRIIELALRDYSVDIATMLIHDRT